MEIVSRNLPLVSAIINTYNYGKFIEATIESVLVQTLPKEEREIIVVDDGSTDDTSARVKRYKDAIKYIYKTNGGQASALNSGFENARGKIIAFLDGDDTWHPRKLEYVVEEFEKSESVDVVYHYMNIVNNRGEVIRTLPDEKLDEGICCFERFPLKSYLKGSLPFGTNTSGITVRGDCLKKLYPIPLEFRIGADSYLMAILPFYAREFVFIRKSLGNYILHGTNQYGTTELTPQKIAAIIKLNSMVCRYIYQEGQRFGYDYSGIKKRMDSVLKEYEILLYNLRGEKLNALKNAVFFTNPMWEINLLYKIYNKMLMLASIILSYKNYQQIREKYKDRKFFKIIKRIFKGSFKKTVCH